MIAQLSTISAWRFLVLVLAGLIVLLMLAVLLDDGTITQDFLSQAFTFGLGGAAGGGIVGAAAKAAHVQRVERDRRASAHRRRRTDRA